MREILPLAARKPGFSLKYLIFCAVEMETNYIT
jgi:hypothetical protein